MRPDFMLQSPQAVSFYEEYAKDKPIIDFHNHLNPKDILGRREFNNLTELWLEGDHYKWRAMRVCGVNEEYITGKADPYEKFLKWAGTVPKLVGSPLYHWVHMELSQYFGLDIPLGADTAKEVWNISNQLLHSPCYDAVGLLERKKVQVLCTTDDPFDSLDAHWSIRQHNNFPFQVLPTFRPDKLLNVTAPNWAESLQKLGARYDVRIDSYGSFEGVLVKALDFFVLTGCRLSDHGFSRFAYTSKVGNNETLFAKAMEGSLTAEEGVCLQSAILRFLAREYTERSMVMQLHMGAIRNNNPAYSDNLGPDTGFDSVGLPVDIEALAAFFNDLSRKGHLPKSILYSLHPADNTPLSTFAINYARGGQQGYVQLGSAWWHLDNMNGMQSQMREMMETGLLWSSVGMLTDSRSLTSFSRHDYYRRILCNLMAEQVDKGLYFHNKDFLGTIIAKVCYNNPAEWFGFTNITR